MTNDKAIELLIKAQSEITGLTQDAIIERLITVSGPEERLPIDFLLITVINTIQTQSDEILKLQNEVRYLLENKKPSR